MDEALELKRLDLQTRLERLGSLVVAYSGGVDSAFLAYAACQALGQRMLAVIADSASLARNQYDDAIRFAQDEGIPLRVVETAELESPEYVRNGADRCFHCKDELFTVLERIRSQADFAAVAYGKNTDDDGDFRPGQHAAGLHHVVAPLAEAGLSKTDVRELARHAGLRLWDKPASACLASRIEYGRPVTRQALEAVERAEDALRRLGFHQFRVRHHGEIARIEIAREEMSSVLTGGMAERIVYEVKQAGFRFVALDLEGYRSGSMNVLLPAGDLARS
ncbi:MAG: ATP-dependent sacrificial sulfur transferase LarE [Acidobacteria bacterium]|nr:MAG: ATP-dependent sacrificial sulfur transferase LarE [Acidobacteriota bacterium]